jgi:HK97 family phage portal protein
VDAGLVKLAGDTDPATAEGALAYHAWYRAISLIAQKVAAVPKHLYRRAGTPPDEGKERARDHAVYKLVHERANAEQTAFQFWLQMAGHVPSRGNAYAAIFTVGGKPAELIPMNPDRTYPVRKDGELWYVAYPFGAEPESQGIRLRSNEVLHFRGFGCDGLVGYPVWAKAAEEVGLAKSQRKLEAARYKNSGRPAMLLQTDAKLDDKAKDRLREDWERMHVGLDNAWRTAILDNGLKANPVSMTAEDLEQAGALQMSLVAISNYTGVPPSKLGASGRNYASQEQEDSAFVSDGLDFYLNVFEDESGAKLLTDEERAQGYEVKASRESLLRPAVKDKFETLRVATAGKPIMTQNEARRQIDLPPSPEPDANKLGTPLNMGQGGIDNTPDDNADPDPGRPAE